MFTAALEDEKASCHICGRVETAVYNQCSRCGSHLHLRKKESVQRCMSYCFSSILAYIPANVWPIMVVTQLGAEEENTILGGVVTFWQMQAYPVAITIFVASVLIPFLKLLSLGWLCALATGRVRMHPRSATRIYWLTELVGRWSMVDVFVVAVLVGLIQLGNLMSIESGPAAISFGLMVILTMLAAHAFDPRIIWDRYRKEQS